jgi:putative nucleotidyltransferase with HDIG domain
MRLFYTFRGHEHVREFHTPNAHGSSTEALSQKALSQAALSQEKTLTFPAPPSSALAASALPSSSSPSHSEGVPASEWAIVLGRPRADRPHPDLDLSPDFTVSRPHARIGVRGEELWIEDMGSTHGTRVNDREIKGRGRCHLYPGDYVRVGETTLRIDSPIESSEPGVEIGQVLDAALSVPILFGTETTNFEAARRLALICELPLQWARETRLDTLLQSIVSRAVQLIPGAQRGALLLRDRESGRITQQDAQAQGERVLRPHAFFPTDGPPVVSRTLARRAINGREGFIWKRGEDAGDGSGGIESGSIIRYSIETGMYAPLLWQGRALGAICVDNPCADSSFSRDDLRLLLMLAQYAAMAVANQQLQEELRDAWAGTLDALTSALSTRDSDTQTHCYRTVELAVAIARQLGISEADIAPIARGALLHDIGKIGISDSILLKPGGLSDEERETVKGHSRIGHDMLAHIPFFQDALPVVLYHHENFDGTGYPDGLRGEAIPRGARIFHVVDLYDALTQNRPYKTAWTHEQALQEIKRLAGTRCDPEVVSALEALDPEVTAAIRTSDSFSLPVRDLLSRGT